MKQTVFCKVLLDYDVPVNVANRAAEVLAKDDVNKPDLGRTDEDKKAIYQAWLHLSKTTQKE